MRKTLSIAHDPRPVVWLACLLAAAALFTLPARAQEAQLEAAVMEPPVFDEAMLEDLVAPIALYPDDVIGIILPAATFPLDVVRAARFLDEIETNPSLEPDESWDDAVVALLNYPEVLYMMDEDLDWTWALGEAVLTDQAAVLDAVQRFRSRAYSAGNLRSDEKTLVGYSDNAITIRSADPEVVYIPVYEPAEVIVYQTTPVFHYHPFAYPVYYYPYPVGYRFGIDYFWGVTSYFSVGWSSHYVHIHHHTNRLHPYYLNTYYLYTPFYPRSRINYTVTVDRYTNIWQPGPRRGSRPRTVTTESRSSTVRTRRSTTTESQPGVTTRSRAAATTPADRTSSRRSGSNFSTSSATAGRSTSDARRAVESTGDTQSQTRSVRSTMTRSPESGQQPGITSTRPATTPATRAPQPRSTTRTTTGGATIQGTTRSTTTTGRSTTTRSAASSGSARRSAAPSVSTRSPAQAPRVSTPAPVTRAAPSAGNSSGASRQSAPRSSGGTTRSRQR